jgi:hypothetical protein
MPQLNEMVLKDHSAVDHHYIPNNISGGVATLVESTGTPIGDKRLTISSTTASTGRRKVTMKLALPVVQDAVVSGVSRPTVVRTAYANIELTFDPSSNTAERQDAASLVASLMANNLVLSAIGALSGLY